MKAVCKYCNKEISYFYRVNLNGEYFCDDECYDEYFEKHEEDCPDDYAHPYIDDYLAIRFEYHEWLNWESELSRVRNGGVWNAAEEMIESIDSVIEEFSDYLYSSGDDGIFSYEIYQYILKLEEIQSEIEQWMEGHGTCRTCPRVPTEK